MSDLVQRLRDGVEIGEIDLADIMDAADEIQRLRLTEDERKAVAFFAKIDGPGNVPVANIRAATLRGLLERLSVQPAENRP